jgi:hypothetical protein
MGFRALSTANCSKAKPNPATSKKPIPSTAQPNQKQSNTLRLTPANSKLENVPRIPHVSQVTSANGKVRSPQSAARKQSKNKLFSIGCFPFLKAHRGITTTTYFTLHVLQHLK